MTKLAARSTVAAVVLSVAHVALAAGDSGTGSVTEMEAGPGVFLYGTYRSSASVFPPAVR